MLTHVQKSAKGILYLVLYIDYNLMIGGIKDTDNTITALKNNGLVLKVTEGL